MSSAAEYRKQAEALFRRAKAERNDLEALVIVLRAIELEAMADDLEHGQVQQNATRPPTEPPRQQPAQKQQQAQQQHQPEPRKKDD